MNRFVQVAELKELKEYIWRGKQIAEKHRMIFIEKLIEDNIPSPSPWDAGVTNSKESPFSDKMILFITCFFSASGISNYGMALAASPRTDIASIYERLKIEIGLYAKDGAQLLIEQGWMEEPP
jgi:p-aminobenzoyl-glutamate transporter AbgT